MPYRNRERDWESGGTELGSRGWLSRHQFTSVSLALSLVAFLPTPPLTLAFCFLSNWQRGARGG